MNRKLTDHQITAACGELLAKDPAASGRALRAELKRRFGSPGKTDRVFAVWRTQRRESDIRTTDDRAEVEGLKRRVAELEVRLRQTDTAREDAEQRALLSAAREIAHQDRWAHELHDLRNEVRRLEGADSRKAALESRVLNLTREVAELRNRLAAR